MAKILVLPSEINNGIETGNSYAFPADNILMSDKTTTVEEAIDNKPGEKTTEGGEVFNATYDNIASGENSHAEGLFTTASGQNSHAEGYSTVASGNGSHAEGSSTTASNAYSHAEGRSTEASGQYSHAENFSTTASGSYSHAEGWHAIASGETSHAEGYYTLASSEYQHVQGKYNIEDSEGVYVHIVGWGSSDKNRKNIHTITKFGDGWFAGNVSAGTPEFPATPIADNDLTTKAYVDGLSKRYPTNIQTSGDTTTYTYNDGTKEMYFKYSTTVTPSTPCGNLRYSIDGSNSYGNFYYQNISIPVPEGFTNITHFDINDVCSTGYSGIHVKELTTSNIGLDITNISNTTELNITFYIHIIGN